MKTGQRYGYADKSEIVKGCVIEVCKGAVLTQNTDYNEAK